MHGIHHTKVKQALDIGCWISATEDHRVRIYWPQRSIEIYAWTPDEALNKMREKQRAIHEEEYDDTPIVNGVPHSGRVAYQTGVPASDCPYPEDSDDFERWNSEWDEAADEAEIDEEVTVTKGSVVTNRYRATYTELGHPTHCGDDLAVLLNNICQNKAGTNLELFEAICAANNVNLSKYNRTRKGWQGRLRMTGRNLLAKRILAQGGRMNMPEGAGKDYYQFDEDWVLKASVKYKPK